MLIFGVREKRYINKTRVGFNQFGKEANASCMSEKRKRNRKKK